MKVDSAAGTTVSSRAFSTHDEEADSNTRKRHATTTRHQSSTTMHRYPSQSTTQISSVKDFKLQELAMLSLAPIVRSIHHWWLQRAERHYLICADVEQQRAREAQMNVAYYQKRAALARSARN